MRRGGSLRRSRRNGGSGHPPRCIASITFESSARSTLLAPVPRRDRAAAVARALPGGTQRRSTLWASQMPVRRPSPGVCFRDATAVPAHVDRTRVEAVIVGSVTKAMIGMDRHSDQPSATETVSGPRGRQTAARSPARPAPAPTPARPYERCVAWDATRVPRPKPPLAVAGRSLPMLHRRTGKVLTSSIVTSHAIRGRWHGPEARTSGRLLRNRKGRCRQLPRSWQRSPQREADVPIVTPRSPGSAPSGLRRRVRLDHGPTHRARR